VRRVVAVLGQAALDQDVGDPLDALPGQAHLAGDAGHGQRRPEHRPEYLPPRRGQPGRAGQFLGEREELAVGCLIQAGVCVPEPAEPAEPAGPLAQWFGPEVLSPTAVLPPTRTELPHHVPRAREGLPVMSAPVRSAEMPASDDFTAAQPELLRRVLDGLRRLG